MAISEKLKRDFETDENINRARSYARRGAHALPSATAEYIIEKAPVVQWLPRYAPKWLLNDVIAGLTIGVMMSKLKAQSVCKMRTDFISLT